MLFILRGWNGLCVGCSGLEDTLCLNFIAHTAAPLDARADEHPIIRPEATLWVTAEIIEGCEGPRAGWGTQQIAGERGCLRKEARAL